MNERIEELWNKAAFDSDFWEAQPRFIERFAELIVLDCIEVCRSRVGNSDYNTGRLHCVSDIRERFGLDGMSTEDKKKLFKELFGVKNETNQ